MALLQTAKRHAGQTASKVGQSHNPKPWQTKHIKGLGNASSLGLTGFNALIQSDLLGIPLRSKYSAVVPVSAHDIDGRCIFEVLQPALSRPKASYYSMPLGAKAQSYESL